MKKVILSLLTLALVTGISSSALATEKIKETEVKPLAAIFYDHEPNDTLEQANPYMIGGQINGEITWGKDSDDFYTFTPTRSGKVSLVFAYSKVFKNTLGVLVSNSKERLGYTVYPGEALQFDVEAGQKYHIRVYGVIRSQDASHKYNVYTEYIN